jgi:polygalacturonase
MKRSTFCLFLALSNLVSYKSTLAAPPSVELPAWTKSVGAHHISSFESKKYANDFGAVPDGKTLSTKAIQEAIDLCAVQGGGTVTFKPGIYLTGALFIKSHVKLEIPEKVTLLGSQKLEDYPILNTRVAGIEMPWPAALINVNDATDAQVTGHGSIDGQGDIWWQKYWTLRKGYEPQGIRWAADYDCQRIRMFVVWNSNQVTISQLHLRRSGFWVIQVTYSDSITVDGITINDNAIYNGVKAPSTDGVDIDSSSHVLVTHCDIDNNDDDICLKAGRDFDGLRVNRPTEYVFITDNICRRGGGVVSFGSETSGTIKHIVAYHNVGIGTNEGLRFKTTQTRGGSIEDVLIRDVTLTNVPRAFTFTLGWDPSYSYAKIPAKFKNVPKYWTTMATPVLPVERGYVLIKDITFYDIHVNNSKRIVSAIGMKEKYLGAMHWENIQAEGLEAGTVTYAQNWSMKNVQFKTKDGKPLSVKSSKSIDSPLVTLE